MRTFGIMVMTVLLALPAVAQAQSVPPKLIRPAVFGTVREITGDALPLVSAKVGCKIAPLAKGPCLDGLTLSDTPLRMLMPARPVRTGDRVSGAYGRDFTLYDAWRGKSGAQLRALELPTSDISVPRNCFSLNGEAVGYGIGVRNGATVAVESQMVSCDGGPRAPHGPYVPEGDPLRSLAGKGWHVTEMLRVAGPPRYLAAPGKCDPQFSVRTDWCAEPGVRFLQTHPGEKELDLIAAKGPVRAGDVLTGRDLDQWVLKRKGDKFKADGRWFDKSLLTAVDGCAAVEEVRWYVGQDDGPGGGIGLFITEKALNRCGAPPAPVPEDIYEAYGDDVFIIDCAQHRWRDRDQKTPDGCFDAARDYLKRTRQVSAYVVVLNQAARIDDHLYDGGYVSYDVARVSIGKDGALEAKREAGYLPAIYLRNCATVNDGQADARGFVIVRAMGVQWARAYARMRCPAY